MSQLPLLPSPYVPMGSHSPTDSPLPHVSYMQSQTAGLTGAELGLEGAARDLRRALEGVVLCWSGRRLTWAMMSLSSGWSRGPGYSSPKHRRIWYSGSGEPSCRWARSSTGKETVGAGPRRGILPDAHLCSYPMPTSHKPISPLCAYALSHFHIRMLVSRPTSVSTSSAHAPCLVVHAPCHAFMPTATRLRPSRAQCPNAHSML